MSDIHGCLGEFMERVAQLADLGFFDDDCSDELVLLGDYIDRGPDSLGVVREAMRLERECPGRVVALMGNHEDEFLRWLGEGADDWDDDALLDGGLDDLLDALGAGFGPAAGHAPIDRLRMWELADSGGNTMRSLLGPRDFARFEDDVAIPDAHAADAFERACARIRSEYAREARWVRGLREFYETDRQVFVHAGIEEPRGKEWFAATSRDTMLWDRNQRRGTFRKDVVAGHTATSTICGDPSFHGALWDGESHYYIDGMTVLSGFIPVLVYDSADGGYHELDGDGRPREIRRW